MAMALAPLALLHEIVIRDASVVSKSYPQFWSDINSLDLKPKKPDLSSVFHFFK